MADTPNTFIQRVVSALLAAFALFGLGVYGGTTGLHIACVFVTVLGIREFSRLAFRHWQMPAAVEPVYWLICAAMYAALFVHFEMALEIFALANVVFLVAVLWIARGRVTNENLLGALAVGGFGLLYCVFFPFFAVRLAILPSGTQWFLMLLLLVLFGDTFAYFAGRWFGWRKMFADISPNKTWAGSVGGLVGTCLAGMVQMFRAFDFVPWYQSLLFCLVVGVVSQSGDLLISLVKRVAHVKDSGHIMPGHGGILDRLDGVFIACPVVYTFAIYVTSH